MRIMRETPSTTFDFLSSALDPRITFARSAATATRVNASGYIESVLADVPRFDYDPITLAPKGLLIEEARTNSVPASSDFAGAFWERSGTAAVTSNQVNGPDNTQIADLFRCGATAASEVRRTGLSIAAGSHTFSVFAKKEASDFVVLQVFDATTTSFQRVWFDLNAGTVGTSTSGGTNISLTSTKIEPYANGFYRCVITVTLTLLTITGRNGIFVSNSNGLLNGNASSGIYLYGAQLEVGAFSTSYIPTTTTALTRNADVATITGTNFSDWWQAGKGSALALARPSTVSGTRPLIQFDDTTANNIIALRGNTTNPELYIKATTDQAQIDAGTIAANTSYRLAGAWATDNCAASVNSGTPVLDGVATIPVVTQARLGSDGTNYLNGHLEAIEYYDERVLNASLQVVSSTAGYRSIIGPVFRDTIIS
jgi:hypothetical protein